MSTVEKIILGIDPGSVVMGYALIKTTNQKIEVLELGVLKLGKLDNTAERLKKIYNRVSDLTKHYAPTSCALEAPFFGKNVQSMLKLGRAQGVAMAAAMQANIPVMEYSPKKVKQSVTGNGNASKEQVAHTVQQILKMKEQPKYLDATDALAVALCHHYQSQFTVSGAKGGSSWDQFIKDNPSRVKIKK